MATTASKQRGNDYETMTHLEHIRRVPDTYIGSTVTTDDRPVRVFNGETMRQSAAKAPYCEGIERLFLEILSNAGDNVIASAMSGEAMPPRKPAISVTVDGSRVTVVNYGKPIPVVPHDATSKKEGRIVMVPEVIFGRLLSSSNYATDKTRIGAGRNGYGAKLANVFSREFVVEVADAVSGHTYRGVWRNGMTELVSSVASPGYVYNAKTGDIKDATSVRKASAGDSATGGVKKKIAWSYVSVSYDIDFSQFPGYFPADHYHGETVALFARHAADYSFTAKAAVAFNGQTFDLRKPKAFTEAVFGKGVKHLVITEAANAVEAIVVDTAAQTIIGFVNGLSVPDGVHVYEVVTKSAAAIAAAAAGMAQAGVAKATPADVRDGFSVIVNCHLPNPRFTSQTKQILAAPRPPTVNFTAAAFKPVISNKWLVYDKIQRAIDEKSRRAVAKTDAGRKKKLLVLDHGEDANLAGGVKASECILYLVEGESAAAQIKQRISMLGGKDYNGYFPMKGKGINVTAASTADIIANKEFSVIKQLVGLADGMDYSSPETAKKYLRYGKIVIAADQDVDGFHVRALIVNMFARWPSLIQSGYIAYLATPLVRVTLSGRNNHVERFYSEQAFEEWLEAQPGGTMPRGSRAVYLKGLASSSTKDIKEDLDYAPTMFLLYDDTAAESLSLAFDPKRPDDRKRWIMSWKQQVGRMSSTATVGVSEFIKEATVSRKIPAGRVAVTTMINDDLTVYSADSLIRAIPSVYDGLKRSQRQALFHALEYWNYSPTGKEPVKVARLSSAAAERVLYQHGEVSLANTYIALAQNFVGTNNVTIMDRVGQLGTRHMGGKDAGAPRYVATKLDTIAPLIFSRESVSLATARVVEGEKVEPFFLPCDIPLGVINGANGIATGYRTVIPPHSAVETCQWLLTRLKTGKKPPAKMLPSVAFNGFTGKITYEDNKKVNTHGTFVVAPGSSGKNVIISELPVGTWTGPYRKFLESLISDGTLSSFSDNSTPDTVKFVLEGLTFEPTEKSLKLVSSVPTTTMTTVDNDGIPTVHSSVGSILEEYFSNMLAHYGVVKTHRITTLEYDLAIASAKKAVIEAIVSGRLAVFRRPEADIAKDIAAQRLSQEAFDALKMSEATEESIRKLADKIKVITEALEGVKKATPANMWADRVAAALAFLQQQ